MSWIADKPEGWDGQVAVILAHGAGQGIDSPFMRFFHAELPARGLLSVMFNFEYMERKRRIPDSQEKLQSRYRRVVAEVIEQHKPRTLIIGGKSMGGRVASYIAHDAPGVHGLVFLGYPLHPPGRVDKMRDAHLYEIQLPMLFLSGTRDTFAERNLLEDVVRKLGRRASLVWTEGGDHSLRVGRSQDSLSAAADSIREWIDRGTEFGANGIVPRDMTSP
jgi:predicted alpha/beta-hydrolase family hydrolase